MHSAGAERRFCPKPFDFFEVDVHGDVWVCCQDWLNRPIGNLYRQSFDEVWNSEAAQEIRRSILDGSYRFCNHATCPALVAGTLPLVAEVRHWEHRHAIATGQTRMHRGPLTLNLGYDNTCNLACKSCRLEIIGLKGEKYEAARRLGDIIVAEGFPNARQVIITGHGDAFGSRLFREMLRTLDASRYPRLKIDLMTNGLLLTPEAWDEIRSSHPAIRSVSVSIDAATPATYRTNRGGDFERLLRNLAFMRDLRRSEAIIWFEISFVVQRNNYREMEAFARLGADLECDSVLFQQLIRWDTYTDAEFRDAAIHFPSHPEHTAFLEALNAPALGAPIVDVSNLSNLLAGAPD